VEDLCGAEGRIGWTIMCDRQKGLELQLALCCHMLSITFVFDTYMQTAKRKAIRGKPLRMSCGGLHR
jgi:hypothetical protein